MRTRGDCGSFPWSMGDIMILNWMWLEEFSWGRSVYVTLKRDDESMETSCTSIIVMENDWWIFMFFVNVWFYLQYEERGDNSSYWYYRKFCYAYVLVLQFSYRIYMPSTFYFKF
jgi:hypothetical protein